MAPTLNHEQYRNSFCEDNTRDYMILTYQTFVVHDNHTYDDA